MSKPHPRPNLEHLRGQAKALLASLTKRDDATAAQTFLDHHPAAAGMNRTQVRAANFRLADAQWAIARREGFASWPKLATHVEQLRALEGTWSFTALEIEGETIPSGAFASAHLLMDGDRFCMRSFEADHDGTFIIDVEAEPHTIDIHFIAGPEAGHSSLGIFELHGDTLRFCLGLTGKSRPKKFLTSKGSGHALEQLVRSSRARPDDVKAAPYDSAQAAGTEAAVALPVDVEAFAYSPGKVYERLAGEWRPVEAVRNGMPMPAPMLTTGKRVGVRNEVIVSWGGQVMLDALVHVDERSTPVAVDYLLRSGASKGQLQLGIMEWDDDTVRFCHAAPGAPRPEAFTCPAGCGRTLSAWRKV